MKQSHRKATNHPPEDFGGADVNGTWGIGAALVHEINQPLSSVQINAQACIRWLSSNPPDITAALASAERAVRAGYRAAEVVKRMRREAFAPIRSICGRRSMRLSRSWSTRSACIQPR